MTFEELYTLITCIEACLNSRPLTTLNNDPNDFDVLTPAHFLIGDDLTSTLEPDLKDIRVNRLSRWQRMEQLRQHFWSRWSREYLSCLQQRSKWRSTSGADIEIGQLVLIKEENVPPLKWLLGRVTEVHRGTDQRVRVVSVKTKAGCIKRAVVKLCKLPVESVSD